MKTVSFDTSPICSALDVKAIGCLTIELSTQDHHGGWELLNSLPEKKEWCRTGGRERAKSLPEQNRKMARDPQWLQTVRASNKKTHAGNNHASGYKHTDDARNKIAEANRSRRWVSNKNETILVSVGDVEAYLARGYVKGRQLITV